MEFHPLSWHGRARALFAANYSNFGPLRMALQLIKMSAFQGPCTFFFFSSAFFPTVNSRSKYLHPCDLVLRRRTVSGGGRVAGWHGEGGN